MRSDPALYYFDEAAADRVCRFFEEKLCHFEGKFAGQPFKLLPWQRKILRDVFGWKRRDNGARRYRTLYIEVPRKNGKSALAAGLLCYLLIADNEPGAQVFAAAVNQKQANITFGAAKKMIRRSPALAKRLDVRRYEILHRKSESFCMSLSGENSGSHGLNISGLVLDELHEWTTASSAELFEALTTSMGARAQPLTVGITTAGHGGGDTLCRELHDQAVKAIAGESDDDEFYGAIFAADPAAKWRDESTWAQANPSLGVSPTIEYLRAQAVKAASSPRLLNSFLRLYLNIWTEQATRWLSLDQYDAAVGKVDPAELAAAPCYVGMDLSQIFDCTAAVELYTLPEMWVVVPRIYCPEETAQRRQREDGTPFLKWAEAGELILTKGSTLDYDKIEADVLQLATAGDVREIAFDPYNAAQMMGRLERAGITTIGVDQNFRQMNAASKEVERRLVNGTIRIVPNAALRWMAANVEIQTDQHGNIRPVKPRRKGKYAGTAKYSIDGIVALIVAASRAILHDPNEAEAESDGELILL